MGLAAAIGERRMVNGRKIEPYQRAVDPGPAGAAAGGQRPVWGGRRLGADAAVCWWLLLAFHHFCGRPGAFELACSQCMPLRAQGCSPGHPSRAERLLGLPTAGCCTRLCSPGPAVSATHMPLELQCFQARLAAWECSACRCGPGHDPVGVPPPSAADIIDAHGQAYL